MAKSDKKYSRMINDLLQYYSIGFLAAKIYKSSGGKQKKLVIKIASGNITHISPKVKYRITRLYHTIYQNIHMIDFIIPFPYREIYKNMTNDELKFYFINFRELIMDAYNEIKKFLKSKLKIYNSEYYIIGSCFYYAKGKDLAEIIPFIKGFNGFHNLRYEIHAITEQILKTTQTTFMIGGVVDINKRNTIDFDNISNYQWDNMS